VLEPLQTDAITCPELRYLRNVPYARHGFVFGDNWIGEMFREHPRYQPDNYVDSTTVEPMLTPADRQNIDMLVAAEAGMQCQAWWEKNGENPANWKFDQDDFDEPDLAGPAWQQEQPHSFIPAWQQEPSRQFATLEIVSLPVLDGSDDRVSIVAGEATPSWLVSRALEGKMIENEWLTPLSCDELRLVEEALYVRHGFNSKMLSQIASLVRVQMVPAPIPNLTREGAEAFFNSQDKLTQLRVNNAQRSRNCQEGE